MAEVVAEAEFEVGLPGAVKLFVLLSSGQTSRPHARLVGQQPPPSEAGQDRNPAEQASVLGGVEVLGGGTVVVEVEVEVEIVGVILLVLGGGGGGGTTAVAVVVVEDIDDVLLEGVGTTTTIVVITCMHPMPSHVYPGRQQPPPGFCGQLLYPSPGQFETEPPQTSLLIQHPTSPNPTSCTI